MQEIFDQLWNLLLGAVPTMLLFLLLVLAYQLLVQGPLNRVLKERRDRTEGALEDARKSIEDAEARAAEYANRLRQARAEALKAREQRVQQWSAERDAALDAAREAAGRTVSEAKAQIETETTNARRTIESAAGQLAEQVVRAVLPLAAGGAR
jgi:F-type H+-transporting ATPase subunit b